MISTAIPEEFIEAYARVSAANQSALGKLNSVLALLGERGIDVLLLKGADILPRLYGVWGIRPMSDVDLLVRSKDLPALARILRSLNFTQDIDGNPAYRDPDSNLALDVITEIWYAADTEEIWHRAVRKISAGLPIQAMGANDLLIYLTAYAVIHRGYFSPFFCDDLSLLVAKEPLDWEFILDEAARFHLRIPLYHGLSHALRHGPMAIPHRVLENLAPANPTERMLHVLFQRLVTEKPVEGLGHFLLLLSQPGRKKWRHLGQALWPSPAFLNYRYGDDGSARPIRTRVRRIVYLAVKALRLTVRVVFLVTRPMHRWYSDTPGTHCR